MKKLIKKAVQQYLRLLARRLIRKNKPLVIAVAGMAHKTSTVKAIANSFKDIGKGSILTTTKNYNTDIGVPFSILGITLAAQSPRYWLLALWQGTKKVFSNKLLPQILILEFGVSAPGDMKELLNIVRPLGAVITGVGYSDFNPQATTDELTKEMAILLEALPQNGFAVLNEDNEHVRSIKNITKARVITFGIEKIANLNAKNVTTGPNGLEFNIGNEKIKIPKFGRHHIYATLAAKAVTKEIL